MLPQLMSLRSGPCFFLLITTFTNRTHTHPKSRGEISAKCLKRAVCADDHNCLTSISLPEPPNVASASLPPYDCHCHGPNNLTLPCAVPFPGLRSIQQSWPPFLKCFFPHGLQHTWLPFYLEAISSQSPFLAPTACWTLLICIPTLS